MHIPHPREIRAARVEIGLSEADAADIVGVAESDWQKWEADPFSDIYQEITAAAWGRFLRETKALRLDDSGFTFNRRTAPPKIAW